MSSSPLAAKYSALSTSGIRASKDLHYLGTNTKLCKNILSFAAETACWGLVGNKVFLGVL